MVSGASRAKIHGNNTGREFLAVETDQLHGGEIKNNQRKVSGANLEMKAHIKDRRVRVLGAVALRAQVGDIEENRRPQRAPSSHLAKPSKTMSERPQEHCTVHCQSHQGSSSHLENDAQPLPWCIRASCHRGTRPGRRDQGDRDGEGRALVLQRRLNRRSCRNSFHTTTEW